MSDSVVSAVRAHLIEQIGDGEPSAASVTFLGVEALDILRFGPDDHGMVRYATLGCSRHPMGDPNESVADPMRGPRAEVVMSVLGGFGRQSKIETTLAILAASPSVEGVVLVPDALIDLGQPLWVGAPFTAVLLGESDLDDLELDEPMDPVRFLSAVPITGTEAAWVRLRGAAALREAWVEADIDVTDPRRGAASL
ncbi:suppressor of fused domain protein [Rhodococcus sp. HNM0569]|uniref:suppressor of fused domain protein n=1 Tax=Rhodococcus sp. HNM0569 TaxID=2716340 RepID=UPI001469EF6E|nr:suppressor of fused domain protein [Rhodococcus sp. HNM0569]